MFQRLLDNSLISFELEEVRYEEVGSLSRTHSSSNWNLDCGSKLFHCQSFKNLKRIGRVADAQNRNWSRSKVRRVIKVARKLNRKKTNCKILKKKNTKDIFNKICEKWIFQGLENIQKLNSKWRLVKSVVLLRYQKLRTKQKLRKFQMWKTIYDLVLTHKL